MAAWNATQTVSREEAQKQIMEKARAQGLSVFNVTYNGQTIDTPDRLPEQVDMNNVIISEKLNQA